MDEAAPLDYVALLTALTRLTEAMKTGGQQRDNQMNQFVGIINAQQQGNAQLQVPLAAFPIAAPAPVAVLARPRPLIPFNIFQDGLTRMRRISLTRSTGLRTWRNGMQKTALWLQPRVF